MSDALPRPYRYNVLAAVSFCSLALHLVISPGWLFCFDLLRRTRRHIRAYPLPVPDRDAVTPRHDVLIRPSPTLVSNLSLPFFLPPSPRRVHRNCIPLQSAETAVHSAYYRLCSEYYKAVGPPDSFYRSALMFLAYTPLEGIPQAERYTLATDISLAALTGEGVFNFGEVVSVMPSFDFDFFDGRKGWVFAVL